MEKQWRSKGEAKAKQGRGNGEASGRGALPTYNSAVFKTVRTILLFAIFLIAGYAMATGGCADFSSKLPNVRAPLCEAAGLLDMQARSVKGRTIWGRDVAAADAGLRVLVIGGIHGDELSSASMVFHWIALAKQPMADMPMPVHWRFVPALNPGRIVFNAGAAHQCQWRGSEPQLSHPQLVARRPGVLGEPYPQRSASLAWPPSAVGTRISFFARADGQFQTQPDRQCACPLWRAGF